ncbi:junctional adhesion molecule-like [Dasypus novemcinctus]|uniref:junctional adhesion molecule-like n=1 Tax=Dasypus novemcinctus TaxID=9361 RepID=UPI00265DA96D|nr:junctional adhesion molecule-like [Dasypus novemcinctus]
MIFPLKFVLMPVLLECSLALDELTVHVGDSALLGCVFRSTEEKRVTKVDWMFSAGKHATEDYVLYYYANLSVPVGRFKNRVRLVGDILHKDGSLLLQDVEKADQGIYTCEIRFEMESLVFKREVMLRVIQEEPQELWVVAGDSTQMHCALQSTEEKHLTKVEWTFSSGEHGKEEIVLHYDTKLNVPAGHRQNQGRFQHRVSLVGNVSHSDGSIMLQGVKESDGGNYTCSIHLEDLVMRKMLALHVILKQPRKLVTSAGQRPEPLGGGNQPVIIVGIVCATVLLLAVLILSMKRAHRNKSSVNPPTSVKNLENTKKADPEKHVYSLISTREVTEEEESSEKSEATYMTMHPVWPSLRSAQNNSDVRMPNTEPAF